MKSESSVSLIMVGIDQWQEYTLPFIKSVRKYEPSVKVIVVDNGSKEKYKYDDVYSIIRYDDTVCYSRAINVGLAISPISDWYILSNNDVICTGRFLKQLEKMPHDKLYGNNLNSNSDGRYVEGWIIFIPKEVLMKVGKFDVNYKVSGYDDVDYSFRAVKEGFGLLAVDLPFTHLRAGTRENIEGYQEIRLANRRYMRKKHGLEKSGDNPSGG